MNTRSDNATAGDSKNPFELTFSQLYTLLRARKWLVFAVAFGVTFLAILYTIQLPTTFSAMSTLNFEFQGSNPLAAQTGLTETSYVSTQLDVIRSKNVAQRVIESLTESEKHALEAALAAEGTVIDGVIGTVSDFVAAFLPKKEEESNDIPQVGSQSAASPAGATAIDSARSNGPVRGPAYGKYSWMASALLDKVLAEEVFTSRIVHITYTSTNPAIAALIANRFADAYIQANLEMITNPAAQTKTWLNEQVAVVKGKVEAAQARLTSYQQQQGIVASDERVDIETKRLTDLTTQLVEAQAKSREALTQERQLTELRTQGQSALLSTTVYNNVIIQTLRSEIRLKEAELAQLTTKLGENHPLYKRAQGDLANAYAKLNKEFEAVASNVHNEVETAKERERSAQAALDVQKQMILGLKGQRGELVVLEREVESAQQAYNTALSQFNVSTMQSMVNQTNVAVIDRATIPRRPSGPVFGKNVGIGFVLGVMLSIALALILEFSDRKVRTEDDLVSGFQLPVLGTLERIEF